MSKKTMGIHHITAIVGHPQIGTGQVGVISYVIPRGSIQFWENRLQKFGVEFTSSIRFSEKYLKFSVSQLIFHKDSNEFKRVA